MAPVTDEPMVERLERETQDAATVQLSIAMMRLGSEHPAEVYDGEGYRIWLRSVANDIVGPLLSQLREQRERAGELERQVQAGLAWQQRAMDAEAHVDRLEGR